jgi:hypothetical protein
MWQGMTFALGGLGDARADTLEHMLWTSENGPLQSFALLHRGMTMAEPIRGRYMLWASENGPLQSFALLHRGMTMAEPICDRYQYSR